MLNSSCVAGCKTDKSIDFDFPGGTVADLLNAFVAAAPEYRWRADGEVIHVLRSGQHVPLAGIVVDYPGATNETRFHIWRSLHDLPEYRAWLKSSQSHPGGRAQGADFKFDRGPIDIPAGRMAISHILDQAATKTGDGVWAVLQSDPSSPICSVAVVLWSW